MPSDKWIQRNFTALRVGREAREVGRNHNPCRLPSKVQLPQCRAELSEALCNVPFVWGIAGYTGSCDGSLTVIFKDAGH